MERRVLLLIVTYFNIRIITGTITLQSGSFCSVCSHPDRTGCRNPFYTSYNFQSQDFEDIRSQDGQYYENGKRCIVSIKAKPNHQIEVTISSLAIDSKAKFGPDGKPIECHDSLKLFNGPTVDNARLLPGIPPVGICGQIITGAELSDMRVFKTTQNELTIQFETDNDRDNMAGFQIRIQQYYFVNPGNLYPSGGNPGGWNDGSFNEFQMNWDDQIVIPGGEQPGGGTDYDKDKNGITCYECNFCQVESYDPVQQGATIKKGCHTCSKEYDNEYLQARRKCYSYTQYNYVLLSLAYGGKEAVRSFAGCKSFVNNFGRTVNYCFCDTSNCNKGQQLACSPYLLLYAVVIFTIRLFV